MQRKSKERTMLNEIALAGTIFIGSFFGDGITHRYTDQANNEQKAKLADEIIEKHLLRINLDERFESSNINSLRKTREMVLKSQESRLSFCEKTPDYCTENEIQSLKNDIQQTKDDIGYLSFPLSLDGQKGVLHKMQLMSSSIEKNNINNSSNSFYNLFGILNFNPYKDLYIAKLSQNVGDKTYEYTLTCLLDIDMKKEKMYSNNKTTDLYTYNAGLEDCVLSFEPESEKVFESGRDISGKEIFTERTITNNKSSAISQ